MQDLLGKCLNQTFLKYFISDENKWTYTTFFCLGSRGQVHDMSFHTSHMCADKCAGIIRAAQGHGRCDLQ